MGEALQVGMLILQQWIGALIFVTRAKLAYYFPSMRKFFVERYRRVAEYDKTGLTAEDFADSTMAAGYLVFLRNVTRFALYCRAWPGKAAPNHALLELDGVTQRQLLEFEKPGRPLVVNFGSCS